MGVIDIVSNRRDYLLASLPTGCLRGPEYRSPSDCFDRYRTCAPLQRGPAWLGVLAGPLGLHLRARGFPSFTRLLANTRFHVLLPPTLKLFELPIVLQTLITKPNNVFSHWLINLLFFELL